VRENKAAQPAAMARQPVNYEWTAPEEHNAAKPRPRLWSVQTGPPPQGVHGRGATLFLETTPGQASWREFAICAFQSLPLLLAVASLHHGCWCRNSLHPASECWWRRISL